MKTPNEKICVRSSGRGREFYQLNMKEISGHELLDLAGNKNIHCLVMDPPWDTTNAARGCYDRINDDEMIELFRDKISLLFDPGRERYPKRARGYLFLWIVSTHMRVATDCLYAAGYEPISLCSWLKLNQSGDERKTSSMCGNIEYFLVGRKTNKPNKWNANTFWEPKSRGGGGGVMYAGDGFADQLSTPEHSSKPERFYTEWLEGYIHLRNCRPSNRGCISFSSMRKMDIFTRRIQPGFISIGNEFTGVRISEANMKCEGCHNLLNDDRHAATNLYCSKKKCQRGWHVSCLFGGNGYNAKRLHISQENRDSWRCPGCLTGDMTKRHYIISELGHSLSPTKLAKPTKPTKTNWLAVISNLKRRRDMLQSGQIGEIATRLSLALPHPSLNAHTVRNLPNMVIELTDYHDQKNDQTEKNDQKSGHKSQKRERATVSDMADLKGCQDEPLERKICLEKMKKGEVGVEADQALIGKHISVYGGYGREWGARVSKIDHFSHPNAPYCVQWLRPARGYPSEAWIEEEEILQVF